MQYDFFKIWHPILNQTLFCFQTAVRNFTIRIQPGHDMSAKSCAYCDYIASPFLIRRELFQRTMAKSNMQGAVPFVDMFLQLKNAKNAQELQMQPIVIVSCIDVMFQVAGHDSTRGYGVSETTKDSWLPLVKTWTINRMLLPGSVEHTWTCEDVNITCRWFRKAGLALPGCCLQELANTIKVFATVTAKHNITICLYGGSVLGPVKIYGAILPWDRDSDFLWDVKMDSLMQPTVDEELQRKYGLKFGTRKTHYPGTEDIFYSIYLKNWGVQLYGKPLKETKLLQGLVSRTKVYLDGMWIDTFANPGRTMRHKYGDDILSHVQHWMDIKQNDAYYLVTPFDNATFLPCPDIAVRHACLKDNFLASGNIQFQDVTV